MLSIIWAFSKSLSFCWWREGLASILMTDQMVVAEGWCGCCHFVFLKIYFFILFIFGCVGSLLLRFRRRGWVWTGSSWLPAEPAVCEHCGHLQLSLPRRVHQERPGVYRWGALLKPKLMAGWHVKSDKLFIPPSANITLSSFLIFYLFYHWFLLPYSKSWVLS